VLLELMHRARNAAEYETLRRRLAPLLSIPLGPASAERAAEVQRDLAHGTDGNHRRPPMDLLLAAAAEEAGPEVTLWFYDTDLRVICEHTGQPYEAETNV
jgi:predicted nucleic acid-binding protein